MHIISRKRLLEFAKIHADSEIALDTWYRIAKAAEWQTLVVEVHGGSKSRKNLIG